MKDVIVCRENETGMKYGDKHSKPQRVRGADYEYLVKEMERTQRSSFADIVAHVTRVHQRMRLLFGTDDMDFIEREVARLRKKAGEEK